MASKKRKMVDGMEYIPKVILAEDNLGFRTALGEFLNGVGYNVATVSNASEALDFYNNDKKSIGLIITDICMPNPDDGIDFIRHITQRDGSLPIIAMSGNATPELTQELAKLDVGFFNKPFDLDAIHRFIERKAQRHLQEPRRIINMVQRGSDFRDTALPGFLNDMSNVPDVAKDRCVIAVTSLSHVNSIERLKKTLFANSCTVLDLCTDSQCEIAAVNRDDWKTPVTVIGSLHALAYEYNIERVGKIAFFGGAAMLPSTHPARVALECKLYAN